MQFSKGVEWGVHAVSLLSALPEGRGLRADALAHYHGVPAAYMAKQLQALSKAKIVHSSRGAHGGYRLNKPPAEISLWDITAAIEGSRPAFRCTEIRQNGLCKSNSENCKNMCPIAKAFLNAEKKFRNSLAATSLADIGIEILAASPPEHINDIMTWLSAQAVIIR